MITDEHVKVVRDDAGLVTVTLDRPGTKNACSMNMWLAIRDAFREISASDARCVILTGANGDFCSGADIVKKPGGADPGWEGNKLTAMRQLAESVVAVHDCPVPVIVKASDYLREDIKAANWTLQGQPFQIITDEHGYTRYAKAGSPRNPSVASAMRCLKASIDEAMDAAILFGLGLRHGLGSARHRSAAPRWPFQRGGSSMQNWPRCTRAR